MAQEIKFGFGQVEEVIDWADLQPRESVVRILDQHGFGRPGQAIPTDWRDYFTTEELRAFLVESMCFVYDVAA